MISRVVNGQTYTLAYDAENRIGTIQKLEAGSDCPAPNASAAMEDIDAQWMFAYDGDGNRITTLYDDGSSTFTTRYYTSLSLSACFGGAYETHSSGMVRKYYSLAGQTVAMCTCTTGDCSLLTADWSLTYFLTDHLGSTLAVLDASGTVLEQQRYLPFGKARELPGYATIGQTDYTYTFQRNLPDTGLMDYRARYYSPRLGRFLQPDTLVPGAANPQNWNRYS